MTKNSTHKLLSSMDINDTNDELFDLKKSLSALGFELSKYEKYDLLKWISHKLNEISDDQYLYIINWNSTGFKKICANLKAGIGANNETIELVNMLCWGNSILKKDVETARFVLGEFYSLLLVKEFPHKFPAKVLYAHVNTLSDGWTLSKELYERNAYIALALPLLFQLHTYNNWAKNRASYYLAIINSIMGRVDDSINYFIDTILSSDSMPNQRKLIFQVIFDSVIFPSHIESIFISDKQITDSVFWLHVSENINDDSIRLKVAKYSHQLGKRVAHSGDGYRLNSNDVIELNAYISIGKPGFSQCDENELSIIYALSCNEKQPKNIRINAYKALGYNALFFTNNRIDLLYYFSMVLYLHGGDEYKTILQKIFIDTCEYVISLALKIEYGLNDTQATNLMLKSRTEPVWVTGDPSRELNFIQRVMLIATSQGRDDIKTLAEVRALFLCVRGESILDYSLRIQHYDKADKYLESIVSPDANLAKKNITEFGFYKNQRHLITKSDFGDYIYIEEPESDRLIIVFSCRFFYSAFTSVPSFTKNKKSNVLFLNNPLCNWYSDLDEVRIDNLIKTLALERFDINKILCYSGSMGGYAALKFSYKHNLPCVAVTPQFNLNLWGLARQGDADRIFSISNMINLDKVYYSKDDVLRACIIIGNQPFDLLSFQSWFDHVINNKNFTIVVIKHDIPEHAGLVVRAYGNEYVSVIYEKFELLSSLEKNELAMRSISVAEVKLIQSAISDDKSGQWVLEAKNGFYFTL